MNLKNLEVWFITGSQDLYGEETLKQVAEHSQEIAGFLNDAKAIPVRVVFKPTVKSTEEIYDTLLAANTEKNCIGIITIKLILIAGAGHVRLAMVHSLRSTVPAHDGHIVSRRPSRSARI